MLTPPQPHAHPDDHSEVTPAPPGTPPGHTARTASSRTPRVHVTPLLLRSLTEQGRSPAQLALALDIAAVPQAPTRVRQWMAGTSVVTRTDLTALATDLHWTLDDIVEVADPVEVVRMLWTPALGAHLDGALRAHDLDHTDLRVSASSLRRWVHGRCAPTRGPLELALTRAQVTVTTLLALVDPLTSEPVRTLFAQWIANTLTPRVSIAAAAAALDVPEGTFEAWRLGRSFPTSSTWEQVAAAFTTAGWPLTRDQLAAMCPPKHRTPPDRLPPLGRALRLARTDAALTHEQVAAAAGVEPRTAAAWETGARLPAPTSWPGLLRVLHLDPDTFEQPYLAQVSTESPVSRGAWIRMRRTMLGMSGADLAAKVATRPSQIKALENDRRAAPIADHVLADALDVSVDRLLSWPLTAREPHPEGAALKQQRLALGLSRPALVARAGISLGALTDIERGDYLPSEQVAGRLRAALNHPEHTAELDTQASAAPERRPDDNPPLTGPYVMSTHIRAKLSAAQVANDAGVPTQRVDTWQTERLTPPHMHHAALARALQVSPEELGDALVHVPDEQISSRRT